MIKINLLPPNLFEGKVIKNIGIAFGALAVVIAVGIFLWNGTIVAATEQKKTEADEVQRLSQQAAQIKSDADSMRAGIAPITQKIKFIDDISKHNESFIDVYAELARFTYRRVVYSQVTLGGDGSMQMQASTPRLGDIGRYLLNMYGATSLFSSVVMPQAPTFTTDSGQGASPGFGGAPMPGMPPGIMPPGAAPMPPGPPGFPGGPTMAAPTTETAGIDAISRSQTRISAAQRRRWTFSMQCALTPEWKTKITPPAAPGDMTAAVGGVPGMPGGAPGMPGPGGIPGPPGAGNQTSPTAIAAPATGAPR